MSDQPSSRHTRATLVSIAASVVVLLVLLVVGWWLRGSQPPPVEPGAVATAPAVTRPAPPASGSPTPPPARSRAAGAPEDTVDAAGDRVPTQLVLRLLATFVHEDRTRSFARIEDVQLATDRLLIEGQSLAQRPYVRLVEIHPDHVVLDNYGVLERLPLDPEGVQLPGDLASRGAGAVLDEEEREHRRALSEDLRILTDMGEEFEPRTTRGGILAEADVQPVYEDGEMVGVQLGQIREGSVYQRAGLADGDVITSINGTSLGGPSAAAQVITALASSEAIRIGVRRSDGSIAELSLSGSELLDQLEALE